MNKDTIAVLFDMDGVLLDTARFNSLSFDKLLKPYDMSIDMLADEHGEHFRGTSLKNMLGVLSNDHGIHIEVETFSREAGKIAFELMDEENIQGDPHLKTCLENLREAGILLGIGTSSLRWRVDHILTKLSVKDYFETIVTAEDVPEHKPSPHVFLETARQLGVSPKNCVVIEDTRSGITAAHRGSMKAIALTAYNDDPTIVTEADFAIDNFSKLTVKMVRDILK